MKYVFKKRCDMFGYWDIIYDNKWKEVKRIIINLSYFGFNKYG